jgi:phosphatidylglycerol:prolipoprotein diacylglycerol transferase
MYTGIPFPDIDPVIFQLGFFSLRWYSLAYLVGILLAWWLLRQMSSFSKSTFTVLKIDDFLGYAILGIILGGRLGYVLFYNLFYFLENPLEILYLWNGGMSFHGGLIGMIITTIIFCKVKKIDLFMVSDMLCVVAPIGLFLGRLANFVNSELFGRVTYNVPWAIIFPTGGIEPRHPSQLYEALWEGLFMLFILNWVWWKKEKYRNRYGFTAGLFFCLYGVGRMFIEMFREPDAHLGLIASFLSMGQILCIPMIVFGAWLIYRSAPSVQFKKMLKENENA